MPSCEGPCLSHCYKCPLTTMIMSKLAIVYLIASAFYLVLTRFVETPFLNSLSCEQRRIKEEASKERGIIFALGIAIGILVLIYVKPYTQFILE